MAIKTEREREFHSIDFFVNVQSEGEREKHITLTNVPPPIEMHLRNEEYDLMTVMPLYCSVVVNTHFRVENSLCHL